MMPHDMLVITPAGEVHHSRQAKKWTLAQLQKAVGGYIELVPHFDSFVVDLKLVRCYAYVDEDGRSRGLPVNARATELWSLSVGRPVSFLLGNLVVIYQT